MRKQNLVLASCFVLVLLTLSVVSAGLFSFTGKAVDYSTKLYQGNERTIPGTSDKIKVVSANDDSAIVSINGESIEVSKGGTETIGEYSVYVSDIGSLFRRYWARVQITEASSGEEPEYCNKLDNGIKEDILEYRELREKDSDFGEITLYKGGKTYRRGYILTPGCDGEGILLKVITITNISSPAYSQDSVKFADVLNGNTYTAVLTQDGEGTVTICGLGYDVKYGGISFSDDNYVMLSSPTDSFDYRNCDFTKKSSNAKTTTKLTSTYPSYEMTKNGINYVVELISASDNSATLQVTAIGSKEITEDQSKEVNGLTIKVINADEMNTQLSATIEIA